MAHCADLIDCQSQCSLCIIPMAWASRDARFCVSQAMMYLFISCFIARSDCAWLLVRLNILRLYFGRMRYCWCFPYESFRWREPVETQDFASPEQWYACVHHVLLCCQIALSSLWDARFCVSTLVGCDILRGFTVSLLWCAGDKDVGEKDYGMGM